MYKNKILMISICSIFFVSQNAVSIDEQKEYSEVVIMTKGLYRLIKYEYCAILRHAFPKKNGAKKYRHPFQNHHNKSCTLIQY